MYYFSSSLNYKRGVRSHESRSHESWARLLELPVCQNWSFLGKIWAILHGFWNDMQNLSMVLKGDKALKMGRGGGSTDGWTYRWTDRQIPLYSTGLRSFQNRCPKSGVEKKNEWEMAGMTCLGNKRIATMFLYMWRRATKLKMIASF